MLLLAFFVIIITSAGDIVCQWSVNLKKLTFHDKNYKTPLIKMLGIISEKLFVSLVVFTLNFKFCQSRRYDNYSLFNVIPQEPDHLKFLQNVDKEKYMDIIFWKKPQKLFEDVHLIVNPKDKDQFLERVSHFKLRTDLMLEDVQSEFNIQSTKNYHLNSMSDFITGVTYHTPEDIYGWITYMAEKHAKYVEVIDIGKSVQGSPIRAVSIKKQNDKPKVIVEGGIHGNEWLAIEFVLYLIQELVESEPAKNWKLDDVARQYHWYLVPVLNPDGFEYTHTTDRLWRKNRKILEHGAGVDLNRNYDYNFGKFGSTENQNEENYRGLYPESEPETKAMADFVRKHGKDIKFYFSFHNYGQKIIIPYGDRIRHIDNFIDMENYGKQAVRKIYRMYKTKYSIGTHYDTMGNRISGNSAAWVKKTFGTKYVFTFLLRDNGTYGYALPARYILPTCEETLVGLVELMTAKRRKMPMQALFDYAPRDYIPNYILGGVVLCMIFLVY